MAESSKTIMYVAIEPGLFTSNSVFLPVLYVEVWLYPYVILTRQAFFSNLYNVSATLRRDSTYFLKLPSTAR